jgi:REP element-mobilizing transposase RayT
MQRPGCKPLTVKQQGQPKLKNPTYNPEKHQRRYHRLRNYDYTRPGWYFVTICLRDVCCTLAIADKNTCDTPGQRRACPGRPRCMRLTDVGQVADAYWREIPRHAPHVVLDEYVIMPDHMHGIVRLTGDNNGYNPNAPGHGTGVHGSRGIQLNAPTAQITNMYSSISPKSGSLAVIIRTYKGAVKTWANRNGFKAFTWQRDFNDRIIRDTMALERIRAYIRMNPCRKISKCAKK